MKKVTTSLFALIGIISLLSLSSCKKIWDEIKHHPNGAADNCRVEKFMTNPFGYSWDTAKIAYNNYGDPVSITYPGFYNTDQAFRYDKSRRLIAYQRGVQAIENGTSKWHKYDYSKPNKIIDTIFSQAHGDLTKSRPESYASFEVRVYELDAYGRIIKDIGDGGPYSLGTFIYTYDNKGNRLQTGITSTDYSDKINIRQTHKVWMLLDHDYSMNQLKWEGTKFNSNKLPVEFDQVAVFNAGFSNLKVVYSCK